MIRWNKEVIINELKNIIDKLGYFPSQNELIELDRMDLIGGINKNGGLIKFRILFNYKPIHKIKGYWNKESTINELNSIISQLGHFPSNRELIMIHRSSLLSAIQKHGGIIYFRELLGHELSQKHPMYWNKENIAIELKTIINQIGHFPTHKELNSVGKSDLSGAIIRNGGIFKFQELFNIEPQQKPKGYWTDEIIVNELKFIISENGSFPTMKRILLMKRYDLHGAISNHGGIDKFRNILNFKLVKKPDGYWTDELITQELQKIIKDINHFPSQNELMFMDRNDLFGAITNNGGFFKFHNLSGYTSLQEKYKSELCSYTHKRGKSSENIVKRILIDYCLIHKLTIPFYNQKLTKGNIIEFVCNTNKKIGIDVTNTESKDVVSRKYTKKQYHLHLDELWIVVFSDVFTDADYQKWNNKSPDNVKVLSIYEFLEELDYSIDEMTKQKIDRYCSCTFHTKDELKNNINF